jgi:hypothetical protein
MEADQSCLERRCGSLSRACQVAAGANEPSAMRAKSLRGSI